MAFSSDGKTLATGTEEGTITVWDLETYEERIALSWDGHYVESLALSPDGRTLVSSDVDARVRIWRTASEEHVKQMELTGLDRRAAQYAIRRALAGGRRPVLPPPGTRGQSARSGDNLAILTSRAGAYAELGKWKQAAADLEMVVGADGNRIPAVV